MKGKIDEQGFLKIYRRDANPGHYQIQRCPFTTDLHLCGDWCPHFGTPHIRRGEFIFTSLSICHGKTLIFDELEDERE